MKRSYEQEIMDGPDIPAATLKRFHRDLRLVHRLTGTEDTIVRRVAGARSVMDIGCGDGFLLERVKARTGAQVVVGVDLRAQPDALVPVVQADATRDKLPQAEVGYCSLSLHHMTEEQSIQLIQNAGRSCRRFVILDLVRHPLPLVLFSLFIGPMLSSGAAADGRLSIRRAYTPAEMQDLVKRSLKGTGATFEHWVSPYRARQIVDIRYSGS